MDLLSPQMANEPAFKVNENGFSALYLLNTQTLQYQQVEDLPMGLVGGMQFNEEVPNLA